MAGVLAAVVAFGLFGSTSLVVKPSNLTAIELVAIRMLVSALALLPLMAANRVNFTRNLHPKLLVWHTLTSAAIFLNMVCLFESFKHAPVSICVALFYVGPVVTLFLRRAFYRRSINGYEATASVFALTAIIALFSQEAGAVDGRLVGYGYAMAGGALFGLIPIFQERIAEESPQVAFFIQAAIAAICLLPVCPAVLTGIDAEFAQVALVLGIAFTLVPFILWWHAIKANRSLNPFLCYVDPLTATLISIVVFSESLTTLEILAYCLLALTVLLPLVRQRTRVEMQTA